MNERSQIVVSESEIRAVEAVRSGDERVIKELYKTHFQLVKRLVLKNSGDEDDARDLYQEAFMVFYENVKDPDFQLKSAISTYLYSISRNLWMKKLRSWSGSPVIRVEDEDMVDVEEDIALSEQKEQWAEALDRSLEKIGEPCRTLLEDFFFHRLSMEEIARKMNYTNAANAKNQKYKCFNRLKKLVLTEKRPNNK